MAERTTNIYKLVTIPAFYTLFQNLLGASSARKRLVKEHYDLSPGMRVLDVGCGPGDLLSFLPDVNYTGIDLNPSHIASAKEKHKSNGRFICDDVANISVDSKQRYDRILFSGLLHHLDDTTATNLLKTCGELLAENGRLVGHEPCYVEGQHPFARWMKDKDSGENIRNQAGYSGLFSQLGGNLDTVVLDDLIRIPYNHIIISWSR